MTSCRRLAGDITDMLVTTHFPQHVDYGVNFRRLERFIDTVQVGLKLNDLYNERGRQLTGEVMAAVQALGILTLEIRERRRSIKCRQAATPATLYISRGATAKLPQVSAQHSPWLILFSFRDVLEYLRRENAMQA